MQMSAFRLDYLAWLPRPKAGETRNPQITYQGQEGTQTDEQDRKKSEKIHKIFKLRLEVIYLNSQASRNTSRYRSTFLLCKVAHSLLREL